MWCQPGGTQCGCQCASSWTWPSPSGSAWTCERTQCSHHTYADIGENQVWGNFPEKLLKRSPSASAISIQHLSSNRITWTNEKLPVFAGSKPLLSAVVLNALQGLKHFITHFHHLSQNTLVVSYNCLSIKLVDIHSVRSPCKVRSACWSRSPPYRWRRSSGKAMCTWEIIENENCQFVLNRSLEQDVESLQTYGWPEYMEWKIK